MTNHTFAKGTEVAPFPVPRPLQHGGVFVGFDVFGLDHFKSFVAANITSFGDEVYTEAVVSWFENGSLGAFNPQPGTRVTAGVWGGKLGPLLMQQSLHPPRTIGLRHQTRGSGYT